MSVLEKITLEYLPKAIKEGKFGADKVKFVEYKPDPKYNAVDQFSSSIYFGDVILETDKGNHVIQSVVIKAQAGGKMYEANDSLDFGLHMTLFNEILFYREILPLLCKCDSSGSISQIFPKCFYAHADPDDPSNELLIFENVQKLGFQLSPWKTFNDYNHINLTLNWIGKFHALSLVCKRKFPEEFGEITSKIQEPHWTEKRLGKNDGFYRENCKRGMLPLQKDPDYMDKLGYLKVAIEEIDLSMSKLVTPVEPLAVICHGDFCRNNIFYKYDQDGAPIEVIFFDFATLRYSSPVIDLSFYVFMNSSSATRSSHWDDILRTYHSALTSNPNLDPEVTPTLEEVKQDFQRRGLYGYTHASYYLPVMTDYHMAAEVKWWKMTTDDLIQLRLKTGGEIATVYVTQIVKHMIDQQFDFKYIIDFKKSVVTK